MKEKVQELLKVAMVVVLSLSFAIPANASLSSSVEISCATCHVEVAEAPADHCCAESSPIDSGHPCEKNDCECPDCPFCKSLSSPFVGVLARPALFGTLPGQTIFSPNIGLDFEILHEAPPLPPPRVG